MSVRKRTLKSGRTVWQVDYRDQSGGRRHKQFQTKREADAYSIAARGDVARGIHTPDSQSITVAKAGELWLASCAANGLEPATIDSYEQQVRLHIVPLLGGVKLSHLSVAAVRDFEDGLREGRAAPDEAKGSCRSPAMIKKIRSSLGTLIANAQELGLVARNTVRELSSSRKRGKEKRAVRRKKGRLKVGVDIPTPAEVKLILAASFGRWRAIVFFAVFTGLRASEIRGLTWAHVDLVGRIVKVRQRADRFGRIGPPKTAAGERDIPMPPTLVSIMKEWKLACPKTDLDLVFPTESGRIYYINNLVQGAFWSAQLCAGVVAPKRRKDGSPVLDEHGQPVVGPKYAGVHGFRHFYASWCINRPKDGGLGLTPKMVQHRMGHSSIVVTLDTYGHLFPNDDEGQEMAAAEKALIV